MKIIEALKRLRIIEKQMDSSGADLVRYSSAISTERFPFGTEAEQTEEVARILQSGLDIAENYLVLKRGIEYTNMMVSVTIRGQTRTISEWLVLRRTMAKKIGYLFGCQNTKAGEKRQSQWGRGTEQTPQVVQFFDEGERNTKLGEWSAVYEEIDPTLEVINATTDLLEPPEALEVS